jgi:hypothetical protein
MNELAGLSDWLCSVWLLCMACLGDSIRITRMIITWPLEMDVFISPVQGMSLMSHETIHRCLGMS